MRNMFQCLKNIWIRFRNSNFYEIFFVMILINFTKYPSLSVKSFIFSYIIFPPSSPVTIVYCMIYLGLLT